MRKILIVINLIWLFTCLVFPAGIQVFKPAHNEVVNREANYTVQWNTTGKAINKVKIRLYDKTGKVKLGDLTNSALNTGQFVWKQQSIKTFPTGFYVVRVKTTDNKLYGDSSPFKIGEAKAPKIGIIHVAELKIPSKAHRHRAPALQQPSNASFSISKIYYDIDKGKLANVKITVKYNSKTAFSFNNYKGDPNDGPAYMNCKISFPRWPCKEPMSKTVWDYGFKEALEHGPPTPWIAFNQRLSVKYGGANNLKCEPQILNPGSGYFQLIFTPVHAHKIMKLHVYQKKKVGPFSAGDWCKSIYPPKIEVRLFIHTKEGVKSVYKQFYLDRTEEKTLTIPGEVSSCSGGVKNW